MAPSLADFGFVKDILNNDDDYLRILETRIGQEPFQGIEPHTALRRDLENWLRLKGIPVSGPHSYTNSSMGILRKAYSNERYFNGWLRNVRKVQDSNSSTLLDDLDTDSMPPWQNEASEAISNAQNLTTTSEALANAADKVIGPRIQAAITHAKSQLETSLNQKIRNTKLELSDASKEQIRELARESAREMMPPRQIEIHNAETNQTIPLGLQHENFEILLRACSTRLPSGFRPNIWLTGPTGSGKTTAAENAARALSLEFSADSSLDADYKVIGFRNAQGDLIRTLFRERFEHGGVYVADEIDNWMPSALLSLNSALANGWCAFPDGMVARHPDCIIIACANTWGLGATNDYVGRSKLDAASLNRFLPKIDWPIDEKLERAIADQHGGEDGLNWYDTVLKYRHAAKSQGLQIIISPRDTFTGISLIQAGFSQSDVISMTFAAGLKPEQRKSLGLDQDISQSQFQSQSKTTNYFYESYKIFIDQCDSGLRIQAIKTFKDHHGCAFHTAKKWVDNIINLGAAMPSLAQWQDKWAMQALLTSYAL